MDIVAEIAIYSDIPIIVSNCLEVLRSENIKVVCREMITNRNLPEYIGYLIALEANLTTADVDILVDLLRDGDNYELVTPLLIKWKVKIDPALILPHIIKNEELALAHLLIICRDKQSKDFLISLLKIFAKITNSCYLSTWIDLIILFIPVFPKTVIKYSFPTLNRFVAMRHVSISKPLFLAAILIDMRAFPDVSEKLKSREQLKMFFALTFSQLELDSTKDSIRKARPATAPTRTELHKAVLAKVKPAEVNEPQKKQKHKKIASVSKSHHVAAKIPSNETFQLLDLPASYTLESLDKIDKFDVEALSQCVLQNNEPYLVQMEEPDDLKLDRMAYIAKLQSLKLKTDDENVLSFYLNALNATEGIVQLYCMQTICHFPTKALKRLTELGLLKRCQEFLVGYEMQLIDAALILCTKIMRFSVEEITKLFHTEINALALCQFGHIQYSYMAIQDFVMR
jgi:hypothetical protein